MLASIIIANYNNKKKLKRCIDYCKKQTYKNIEILVHDDYSTDGSQELLKQTKNIKYILNKKKKKIPYLDAMNSYERIFYLSKGNYIFFLDSDDYFHKDKIKKVLSIFKKNRKISFVQNSYNFLRKKNKNFLLSRWPYFAPTSCLSVRRKDLKTFFKYNKFIKNKFNNVWLDFRICSFFYFKKKNFFNYNEMLTFYDLSGDNHQSSKFNYSKWIDRRFNSHLFVNFIQKKTFYLKNIDYSITKFLNFFQNDK